MKQARKITAEDTHTVFTAHLVEGATDMDYYQAYEKAMKKLEMQRDVLRDCGLIEEAKVREQGIAHCLSQMEEHKKNMKRQEYEMYLKVMATMMAVDIAHGLAYDFAQYVKKTTRSDRGMEFVADVEPMRQACKKVLDGMEVCFTAHELQEYSKWQTELEDKVLPLYQDYAEVVAKKIKMYYK